MLAHPSAIVGATAQLASDPVTSAPEAPCALDPGALAGTLSMSRNRYRGQRGSRPAPTFSTGDRVQYRQSPTQVIRGVVRDVQFVPNGFGGRQLQAHIRWDNGASAWTPLTRAIELAPTMFDPGNSVNFTR